MNSRETNRLDDAASREAESTKRAPSKPTAIQERVLEMLRREFKPDEPAEGRAGCPSAPSPSSPLPGEKIEERGAPPTTPPLPGAPIEQRAVPATAPPPSSDEPQCRASCPSAPSPSSPLPGERIEERGAPPPPSDLETIPARMMNEFVYCPRLFYYEFVEGAFVENADTLRGAAIHQRVDSGTGAMPPAPAIPKDETAADPADAKATKHAAATQDEVIHSRSVQMGSERLGVVAKMDLVETRLQSPPGSAPVHSQSGSDGEPSGVSPETSPPDLFAFEVCPVDYKAGSPKQSAAPTAEAGSGEPDGPQLWDTDKMQLGLQALILRDNGYTCREGIIYYRATKQRVRLPITPELIAWIEAQLAQARQVARGPIPPPLENSPKCVRCSLAPICLPDETRLLSTPTNVAAALQPAPATSSPLPVAAALQPAPAAAPRRLIAARDDSRALYLNTPGLRIGITGDCLQVKEKERLLDQVRVRDVDHVALFGNIQISTQAVQTLCQHEIPITYFSMGGWFYGITRGHELKNVFLRKRQFQVADDPRACLPLARQIVFGKIRNHRTMLMRNHVELSEIVSRRLKAQAENSLRATSLEELLGIEGAAASLYFENLNGMIKAGDDLVDAPGADARGQMTFHFEHRKRRPPTDPVNALLGLAYSALAKDAAIAAMAVGFDPYIGFYHQPRFGRPALALDLMEEFRPLIAESTVLNAINTRVITEGDFVRAGQAVNLTSAGRKKFFQTYEQRITSLVTHPVFEYKVSYRRALELQARILAKCLTGEITEYIPFMTR